MADLPFRAVVELITVIEERLGFEMDGEHITAEVFESVGWLSTYVSSTAASKARATFRNSELGGDASTDCAVSRSAAPWSTFPLPSSGKSVGAPPARPARCRVEAR